MKPYKIDLKIIAYGFIMGAADIVPGVSGGTVAFVLGIYDRLVSAIANINKEFFKFLFKRKFKKALTHIDFFFLLTLLTGIGSSIILLSRAMNYFLTDYPEQTWALFLGLIVASIFYLKNSIKGFYRIESLISVFLGTIGAYVLVGLIPTETPNDYITIFFSGFIAIIAMILPGISGSFILLLLGKYVYITSILKSPFSENHLFVIITFCLGCFFGLTSFSRALKFLLSRYNTVTLSFLTGFMVGSLRKVWPWKETTSSMQIGDKIVILSEKNILPQSLDLGFFISILLCIFGFLLVFFLERKQKNVL